MCPLTTLFEDEFLHIREQISTQFFGGMQLHQYAIMKPENDTEKQKAYTQYAFLYAEELQGKSAAYAKEMN